MPVRILQVLLLAICLGTCKQTVAWDEAQRNSSDISVTAGSLRRCEPGTWTSVKVIAENSSDEATVSTVTTYFGNDSHRQFARRLWVPPHSRRMAWLPVQIPAKDLAGKQAVDLKVLRLAGDAATEVLVRRDGETLVDDLPILLDHEANKTALILRQVDITNETGEYRQDRDVVDLVNNARQAVLNSTTMISLFDRLFPPQSMMWESLDQLVLCSDHIINDSAGISAIRTWLHRGGRLWIFLDRVSPETVAAIVGHANTPRVFDRVELNDFVLEDCTESATLGRIDRRHFEEPVSFVRVVADHADVHCRVNGWPAAFWQPAGDGEVLFMALSPNAWEPAQIKFEWNEEPRFHEPDYRQRTAMTSVATRFFVPAAIEPEIASVARPILNEQIGYSIPSGSLAWGLLIGNALVLLVGGLWLAKRQQLEKVALLLPVVAGVTTTIFLSIGHFNSRSVPASLAQTQLVRHIPETQEAFTTGLAAMYQHDDRPLQLSAGSGGIVQPFISPREGATQRLMLSDAEEVDWRNVTLAANSVQFSRFENVATHSEAIRAVARFGPRGLAGHLDLKQLPSAADVVIAALPGPPASTQIKASGEFLVTPHDVLDVGQFLTETVVTDESRRRQEIYRSLIAPRDKSRFATLPTLLAWTTELSPTLRGPADLVRQSASLVSIPISLVPTATGEKFLVPSTFIRQKTIPGEKGMSIAFDARTGRWTEGTSRSTNTRLQFVLPAQVTPCRATSGVLTMRVNAPSRALKVCAVVDGRDVLIESFKNPSGVYSLTVERPEWLTLDETGSLQFSFLITEAVEEVNPNNNDNTPPESFTVWSIDYVRLDVHGETL